MDAGKCGQSWPQAWPWRCKGWGWETQIWKHSEMYLHGIWDSQYPLGGEFSFRVREFKYTELPGPTWSPCLPNKRPTLMKKSHEDFPGDTVEKHPLANAGYRGPCLLWEDSTCQGTMKRMSHDYWHLCALRPACDNPRATCLDYKSWAPERQQDAATETRGVPQGPCSATTEATAMRSPGNTSRE